MTTKGEEKLTDERKVMDKMVEWLSKLQTRNQQERTVAWVMSALHSGDIPCSGPPKEDSRQLGMEQRLALSNEKLRYAEERDAKRLGEHLDRIAERGASTALNGVHMDIE